MRGSRDICYIYYTRFSHRARDDVLPGAVDSTQAATSLPDSIVDRRMACQSDIHVGKSMIYSNKEYSVFGNLCKQADGDNLAFTIFGLSSSIFTQPPLGTIPEASRRFPEAAKGVHRPALASQQSREAKC